MKRIYKVRTIIAQWEMTDDRGQPEEILVAPGKNLNFSWFRNKYDFTDYLSGLIYIEELPDDPRVLIEGVNFWLTESAFNEMTEYYTQDELDAVKYAAAELAWSRRHNSDYSVLVAEEPVQIDFSCPVEQLPLGI
jgi:hypothetical protein